MSEHTPGPTGQNMVVFGWGGPPMKEQHPILPDEIAAHFDKDNEAVIRLSIRGLLTESAKKSALARLTKNVESEIRTAIAKAEGKT